RTNILERTLLIAGTNIPATANGFGVGFADVDSAVGGDRRLTGVYDSTGRPVSAVSAPVSTGGLSFVGTSHNAGERDARVVIESGNSARSGSNNGGVSGIDVVVMDDMIYGEPRAATYHEGDFDGDGTADISVFRPSTGNWFTLQSGSNTVFID